MEEMKKKHKEDIERQISKLREDLNEICSTSNSDENCEKKLNLSGKIDKLIIEYMKKE